MSERVILGVFRRSGHLRCDQLDRQGDRQRGVAVAIDLGQGGEDMEVVRQRRWIAVPWRPS
jgi:hypothetical protein